MRIAAREESTCCSPQAMRGNGTTTSAIAKAESHRSRCQTPARTSARQARARSTTAPVTTLAQATKAGGTPSSTATLIRR